MSGGDLKPRLISGIAALLVVLPDLILGGFWGVLALAAVAAAWSWHEIVSMAMKEQRASAWPLGLGRYHRGGAACRSLLSCLCEF